MGGVEGPLTSVGFCAERREALEEKMSSPVKRVKKKDIGRPSSVG